MSGYLIDTCVLIDYLRDREAAVQTLRGLDTPPSVSVVTVAELYAGVRDQREERGIETLTALLDVRDVDHEIARLAGRFRFRYRSSHGVGLPDALIAATAQLRGLRLITRNARHYPMLADLLVP